MLEPKKFMNNGISCDKCQTNLVATQKQKSITFGGIVGVILFFIGVGVLAINLIAGGVIILFGLVISFSSKGMVTTMVCPSCGWKGRTL
jgi:C4-type Zn-finger protein